MTHPIRTLLAVALVLSLALVVAGPLTRASAAAPAPQLRVVGPAGEDPPVVNERKNIRLRVIDETGAEVAVTSWRTGSPSVAKVTKKGVLKGRLYGFATVTAQTGRGEASTTAVVARVTRRHGSMGDGDTKSDSAGRIYLTSPDEQVIYRSDGVRDEIFAGSKGEAGYQDGTGQNARFDYPTGLGVDVSTNGGLYVADTDNHCIRKVGFDGRTSIATGVPQFPGRINADVVPADEAVFDSPKGVAAYGQALFVADTRNHALYYLNGRGDAVSLLAGQPGVPGFRNGLFREASFNLPSGLAINTEGNLVAVADTGNDAVRLVRIEPGGNPYLGRVSTAGVASKAGRGTPGSGFVFSAPTSVAFDSAQNVCVVDSQGASVITRAADGTEARVLLAQPGSLGRPASIVVSGTRAIIADADASSPGLAIAVVEVGAPKITGLTPSRLLQSETAAEIVITGENFPPEARVVIDGHLFESARVESATRIVVGGINLERGARLVSVVTRGGVAQYELDVTPPPLADIKGGQVTTYAGTSQPALGDGALATAANLAVLGADSEYTNFPTYGDVAVDSVGNVYFASPGSYRVRRIDAQSSVITTFVGVGKPKIGIDGSPAAAFGLYAPVGVAIGPDGALFIADAGTNRVVRVDPVTTETRTVLGKAEASGEGADGAAGGDEFLLRGPNAIAVDRSGNLFVSDFGNLRVLCMDAATRIVRVVAGGGPVVGLPTDGHLPTATRFPVSSVDIDSHGQIALAIQSGFANTGALLLIGHDGKVRSYEDFGQYVRFGVAGELYCTSNLDQTIVRLELASGDQTRVAGGGQYDSLEDGIAATSAYLAVAAIAVDGSGNVMILDTFGEKIRRVDHESGRISTIGGGQRWALAGDGRIATSARLSQATDIEWVEGVGLCIADTGARGVRVINDATGLLTTPIGNGSRAITANPEDGDLALGAPLKPRRVGAGVPFQVLLTHQSSGRSPEMLITTDKHGRLSFIGGGGTDLADGIPARSANFGHIAEITTASNGDIVIVDSDTRRVRLIEMASRSVRTIAGRIHDGSSYDGEGGPAVAAAFVQPGAVAISPDGELFIADGTRICKVTASGIIKTVSGGADQGIPAQVPIVDARYGSISSLAFGPDGRLYVADFSNHMVVALDFTLGMVSHVIGSPDNGVNSGDGALADGATVEAPTSLSFDTAGNLYILAGSAVPSGFTDRFSAAVVVRVIKAVEEPRY